MEDEQSWWEEKRSAYLYGTMARYEANVLHKKLFLDLKEAAEKQAHVWEEKMHQSGVPTPLFQPDFRTKLVARLVKWLGTDSMHSILSAMKIRGMSVFTHYHREHRHTGISSANNLRAAVFGINDGLISNMSLILGIAGASQSQHFIVIAGIAGLLAGACSMGAGEYISVRSQREVFEYQIAVEQKELEEYPEEEAEELSLIYQARGVPKAEATHLANIMIANPETGLNALVREELGLNPEELVSPMGAMLSSFFSFAIGAFVPIAPFLFDGLSKSLCISLISTGLTLFSIGAILSLYTNKNPLWQGLRMLFVGCLAGSLTYLIGNLFSLGQGPR
ncbi:MAG TPA: VIT1/CCC1 transporter family protein [Gammaproteobacteria bacterium]|jgi:VIT1/CCC1 family predicted Fe2+/Mn2+ transporter|nr:VIT1/CCC1 transporter family protein [Gammaproteobacteria bacterium]